MNKKMEGKDREKNSPNEKKKFIWNLIKGERRNNWLAYSPTGEFNSHQLSKTEFTIKIINKGIFKKIQHKKIQPLRDVIFPKDKNIVILIIMKGRTSLFELKESLR